MRPVIKWNVGQHGVVITYNPHGDAKEVLLNNFGNEPFFYCSYCDRQIPKVNIEVEHIQPVHYHPELEFSWSNFLVACKNCNRTKGDTRFAPGNVLLPQIHNTWNCFLYNGDGTVTADPANALAYERASASVALLGLDRGFGHPRRQLQDDRYDARRYIMRLANRCLKHFEDGVDDYIETIIDMARTNGFWSVWMTVFENHPGVQEQLIASFNGTYINCMTTNTDRL